MTSEQPDMTFEELRHAVDDSRELQSNDAPAVYVMTTAACRLILIELNQENMFPPMSDRFLICGQLVEHYTTLSEVYARCILLRSTGVTVGVVCE